MTKQEFLQEIVEDIKRLRGQSCDEGIWLGIEKPELLAGILFNHIWIEDGSNDELDFQEAFDNGYHVEIVGRCGIGPGFDGEFKP